jgi:hypothetical protein
VRQVSRMALRVNSRPKYSMLILCASTLNNEDEDALQMTFHKILKLFMNNTPLYIFTLNQFLKVVVHSVNVNFRNFS